MTDQLWDDMDKHVWLCDGAIHYDSVIKKPWAWAGGDLQLLLRCVADNIRVDADGEWIKWPAVRRDYERSKR